LHIVAVTAYAAPSDTPLAWGGLYYYDLFFQLGSHIDALNISVPVTAAHLNTPGILNVDFSTTGALHRLVYPGHPLPSFVLPSTDVNQLRIVHGSCRKPHGAGKEMLSALDTILETSVSQGTPRPQQLFLTGDQIYADDVAAPLLFALTDAGDFLLEGNAEEVLPGGLAFIETSAMKTSRRLLLKESSREQAPGVAARSEAALAHEAAHGTNRLERSLAKRRGKLVTAIFRSVAWLNWWKAGELIIAYNCLGEIRFEWDAPKKRSSNVSGGIPAIPPSRC
jgi:hypothetical protein